MHSSGLPSGGPLVSCAVPGAGALCSGREQARPLARAGAVVSLISPMVAGMFITIDFGHSERAWMLAAKAKLHSPLIWDFLIGDVLLGVAALYTAFGILAVGLLMRFGAAAAAADSDART